MLKNAQNSTIYLKDYQAPEFKVLSCKMNFNLEPDKTIVSTYYQIEALTEARTLILDGEGLQLLSLEIDGKALSENAYTTDKQSLNITQVPEKFELHIQTQIAPSKNTSLNGLYQSGDMLCTQCEAQGFRRITYSFDRPDVLTTYTVKLTADKALYPVLLSNGNLVEQGNVQDNNDKHFAVWHDPFPKATYLFALVAGQLHYHSDTFTTRSGKEIDLHILTRKEDVGKTAHAMASLQRSMLWDEQAYDREYDLDVFHIVAVSDFNMGAMENKSLNVFNTKYVLARQEIATDQDYHGIEGVIGHEYFHNWSGNRVTCRDWFQLSLKEGFTVLRDQQFSGAMGSVGVQRIDDVSGLRNVQFREDAGPMAHPIRPDSYEEINNFYTATVYEKGAEVVRMIHTLLGETAFKKACNLYFKTFDGQAVTTDDFVDTMQQSSGIDLSQFRRWYAQAGTPVVRLSTEYDAEAKTLRLDLSQHTAPTPKQDKKQPFLIPLKTALFDQNGQRLHFTLDGTNVDEAVLHLSEAQQSIVFEAVEFEPVVSTLRGFSAPIKLVFEQDSAALSLLAKYDDDSFSRWEAMQTLGLKQIHQQLDSTVKTAVSKQYLSLFSHILNDTNTDPALLEQMLYLPSASMIGQQREVIEPEAIYNARERIITAIAKEHQGLLLKRYAEANQHNTGIWKTTETGQRALRDACLSILMRLDDNDIYALAGAQYQHSLCMTDTMAALANLSHSKFKGKQPYLDDFHQKWQAEDLLVNKWFSLQSQATDESALDSIKKLMQHTDFELKNPNKVYALIGGFLHGNAVIFHASDGSGYEFAADTILKLDAINPQIASRMVSCFNQWKRYNTQQQALMHTQMQRIADHQGLSDNVSEIIHKALA